MKNSTARLAQSVERKALNLVVVGSSPTVGVLPTPMGWRTALRFLSRRVVLCRAAMRCDALCLCASKRLQ